MNSFDLQLIGFQLVIVIPFIMGAVLQRYFAHLEQLAGKIVILNLTLFEPPIIFWSIWGLALRGQMMVLPLAGLLMVMLGFGLGKVSAPLLINAGKHRKVFVISSSLANHGFTMGGVICYLFLGEKGLALAAIFIMYFIPFTFLFIFFYAGKGADSPPVTKRYLFDFFVNIRNMPLYAVIGAVCCRWMGVERPEVGFPLNTFLATSIGLYYFTLGINFKAGDLNPFKREHGLLAAIKFLIIPAFTYGALLPVNLSADLRQVILIQAFMPAAVYSVITSVLFNLETRFASSLFIVNSVIFIVLLLPLFYWLNF